MEMSIKFSVKQQVNHFLINHFISRQISSSIEHGGTSTLYNFMEKFFGTKRLHKRIWKSDGTRD